MGISYNTMTAHRTQFTYCPVDYAFEWTTDDQGDWYEWDRKRAIAMAKTARNEAMKAAKASGRNVKAFSIPDQQITKGGIGSGRPEVSFVVTVYGFNVIG